MVDTGVKAEIQHCIRNAQDCMMEMGKVLGQLPAQGHSEKPQLMELCKKTGVLLEEAQQRCEKVF